MASTGSRFYWRLLRRRHRTRSREVPDYVMHDEDCNSETIGNQDHDGDGIIDMRVCNWLSYEVNSLWRGQR